MNLLLAFAPFLLAAWLWRIWRAFRGEFVSLTVDSDILFKLAFEAGRGCGRREAFEEMAMFAGARVHHVAAKRDGEQ